jgi:hypothetical protein
MAVMKDDEIDFEITAKQNARVGSEGIIELEA